MFHSQIIAAADPTPFNKPRFIRWPSVGDTTRTNWLVPDVPNPAPPLPALQIHVEYADMWGRHSCLPDERVLAACSSIDCIATRADPSLTCTAIAAQTWDSTLDLGLWTLDVAPGIPLPTEKAVPAKEPQKPARKPGRPLLFDEIKRAEVCAMVRTGCSVRNAAQNAGVKIASIYYACRTDTAFAAELRSAEKERDVRGIGRINNAGEKSWRATAWLLERASPKHFSLRGAKKADTPRHLRKRQLRGMVADILYDMLKDCFEAQQRPPIADLGLQAIENRLAEIDAQRQRMLDSADDDDELDDTFDDDDLDQPEDFENEEPAEDDEPSSDDDEIDDADTDENERDDDEPESEDDKAAAVASFKDVIRRIIRSRT